MIHLPVYRYNYIYDFAMKDLNKIEMRKKMNSALLKLVCLLIPPMAEHALFARLPLPVGSASARVHARASFRSPITMDLLIQPHYLSPEGNFVAYSLHPLPPETPYTVYLFDKRDFLISVGRYNEIGPVRVKIRAEEIPTDGRFISLRTPAKTFQCRIITVLRRYTRSRADLMGKTRLLTLTGNGLFSQEGNIVYLPGRLPGRAYYTGYKFPVNDFKRYLGDYKTIGRAEIEISLLRGNQESVEINRGHKVIAVIYFCRIIRAKVFERNVFLTLEPEYVLRRDDRVVFEPEADERQLIYYVYDFSYQEFSQKLGEPAELRKIKIEAQIISVEEKKKSVGNIYVIYRIHRCIIKRVLH